MNLIIVDDEIWSIRLIKNVLPWRDYGFKEIFEARGGEEAIELIENNPCALMITDMRMPGVDGAMLLEYINDHNINIEVIVMSGYEDYKYLHSALKTKAIDYLLKPIVKEELENAVKRALSKISQNQSEDYIEEIFKREDLKNEINTYYEYKTLLLKYINQAEQENVLKYSNLITQTFFDQPIAPALSNYIHEDIKRMLSDLEKEQNIDQESPKILLPSEITNRLLEATKRVEEKKQSKKVTALEIQQFIHSHFTENITLNSIAEKYYLSKEHLSRMFKKEVGVSIQNYITSKKIDYAKKLLRNHEVIPISTIAHMSGYNDIHYFYRVFKKMTNLTPLEYQNSIMK